MKKLLLILGFLFICSPVFGKENEGIIITHFAAHAGTSYAITHTSKVICDKIFQADIPCLITGMAISAGMGAVKEYVLDEGGNHTRAWIANGTGIVIAATLISIDF